MIKIRVDDFPHTKDEERYRHNLTSFRDFHQTLMGCIGNKRYLLGVIPGRCTPEDILFLRNETDCVIGMHGINHDEKLLDIYRDEFPPYSSKYDRAHKLKEARLALEAGVGRPVEVYMPPRNYMRHYQFSHLGLGTGFKAATAGPETDPVLRNVPGIYWSDLPHEYGRTDEMYLRGSYDNLIRRAQFGGNINLTLHWTWETNIGLQHMVKFFNQIPSDLFEDFVVVE